MSLIVLGPNFVYHCAGAIIVIQDTTLIVILITFYIYSRGMLFESGSGDQLSSQMIHGFHPLSAGESMDSSLKWVMAPLSRSLCNQSSFVIVLSSHINCTVEAASFNTRSNANEHKNDIVLLTFCLDAGFMNCHWYWLFF
jgi:hypothetical protein